MKSFSDILRLTDPGGGWRVFVAVFMFTTLVMLGFVSLAIAKAYQDGQTSVKVVCQAIDIALPEDEPRPADCLEYLK